MTLFSFATAATMTGKKISTKTKHFSILIPFCVVFNQDHAASAFTTGTMSTTNTKMRIFGSNTRIGRHRHFSSMALSNQENDDDLLTMTTSADITEVMRQESINEMKTLMDYFGNQDDKSEKDEPLLLMNDKDVTRYIDENIDTILFDCDGVLYRGTDPIPDAAQALQNLISKQKQIFFVTNNAASNRQQLRDKLATLLKCPSLTKEQMLGSAYSAACYLKHALLLSWSNSQEEEEEEASTKRVHVIGVQGLYDEIANVGFQVTGGPTENGEPAVASMSRDELASYPFPPPNTIDAVVIGLDTEFTYRKLCIANVLLQQNPNALLIATNRDAYDLVGVDSRHLPGNGALVAALEVASQRTAINVGKPSSNLANLITKEYKLDPSRTLMVGDRLDTDIKFGLDGNMKSGLVMTGCTTATKIIDLTKASTDQDDERDSEGEPLPTVIFPHMGMMSL